MLRSIIDKINIRNGSVFKYEDLSICEEFLLENNLDEKNYIGHGGSCISFRKNNLVYKICVKSSEIFHNKYVTKLTKLLPVETILYKNNNFFIYNQKHCEVLTAFLDTDNITPLICVKILEILSELHNANLIVFDNFITNFGIYNGDVYMFDYHDISKLDNFMDNKKWNIDVDGYLINIFNIVCFALYGKLQTNLNPNIQKYSDLNLGDLPGCCVKMLNAFYNADFRIFLDELKNTQKLINSEKIYKLSDYQIGDINELGQININSSTLMKYNVFNKIFTDENIKNNSSFLDAGCCIGLIGLKLLQTYPNLSGTFCNINKDELDKVKLNYKKSIIKSRAEFISDNAIHIGKKYDITIYFSLIHHLLRNNDIEFILEKIYNQTNNISVVEIPLFHDVLLQNLISSIDHNANFNFTINLFTIIKKLEIYFNIIDIIKIDYKNNELCRYAFILSKK